MKKKTIAAAVILLIFSLGIQLRTAGAEDAVEVISQEVEYTFGDEMAFRIQFSSSMRVVDLTLFIQAPDVPTFVGSVSIPEQGSGYFLYELSQRPLPAFSNINYYYQFTLSSGGTVNSPPYNLTYLDNRFNWQELDEGQFKIYWYQGEITLAQEVRDAAVQGQEKILQLLQQPADNQPITVFIYASEEDLQTTLSSIGQTWVSGHADPALGSMVVALPAAIDRPLEIQRLIPHELTHIMLYRFMGAEYQYLPAWFSEGLASLMEAYTLPEYELALERAHAAHDLIPFAHICQAFPADADLALLSYAQSESLVRYLKQQYGLPALQAMIYAYDQGVSCDRGVENALGLTLTELEKEWQQAVFGEGRILLYIYVLGAVLLVLVLTLGIFLYSKLRTIPKEEDWGDDEPAA
jgi:hypothetical protein